MDNAEEAKARWDELFARLDEGRTEERHGEGVLSLWHGRPRRATGCLLPDGATTDARCAALPERARDLEDDAPIDPAACVWQRRLSPEGRVARRGRVVVEPGVALRFVDEPEAGEEAPPEARAPSLERDLAASPRVVERAGSEFFATLLYAALCNTEWRHRATGERWSCSWRSAGGVVAHVRGEGDYLDWYCSGGEGLVDEGVLAEIEALGWALVADEAADLDEDV